MALFLALVLLCCLQPSSAFLGFGSGSGNAPIPRGLAPVSPLVGRRVDTDAIHDCVEHKIAAGKNFRKVNEFDDFHLGTSSCLLQPLRTVPCTLCIVLLCLVYL